MKAIIVAGGRGERLKPITDNIPKPMIEVAGKPILLHIIELLKKYGVEEFILALCYLPNVIIDYFGDGRRFGIKISYTFESPSSPLGTAGAISLSRNSINDTFIVTYADILRELDIKKVVDFHKKNKAFATLNIYERQNKRAKSMVIINENNKIVKFIERPNQSKLTKEHIWVNGSFYVLEPEIFDFIPKGKKSDFGADIFPKLLLSKKDLYAYPTTGYFVDIGDMTKLDLARRTFRSVRFNSSKFR